MLWLDDYERRARLAPGLLLVLPVAIAATLVGLRDNPILSAVVGLLVSAGGPVVVAGFVRQRGLAAQDVLFATWGGPPTTLMLRCEPAYGDTTTRDRRRVALEAASGATLPTAEEEQGDAGRASEVIGAAVAVLRERTRDKVRFELVYAENKNFGFERNLYAIRIPGIVVSIASALTFMILWLTGVITADGHAEVPVGQLILVALVLAWWVYPSSKRVRESADKYAGSLLDAASAL